MSADSLVTLIVAAYRTRPEHLRAALASALAQTHAELEIIVSDDSPDHRLGALVAAFADPRLHYQHHPQALGAAQNHARCLQQARGSFVAILNHDDALAPEFVARTRAALRRHPSAVLAFCDHHVVDADGRPQTAQSDRVSARWGRAMLASGLHRPFTSLVVAQSIPMAMGTLIRRTAVPHAPPRCAGPAYDLWLSYLLARHGGGAVYLPERLSAWRDHAGSLTHQGGLDWLRGAALCWEAMADDAAFTGQRALLCSRVAAAWVACARAAWRQGRVADSRRYAARSLQTRFTARGVAALGLSLWPAPAATRLAGTR